MLLCTIRKRSALCLREYHYQGFFCAPEFEDLDEVKRHVSNLPKELVRWLIVFNSSGDIVYRYFYEKADMNNKVKIWADGSCSGNPGCGGWACLIVSKEGIKTTLSGNSLDTTNNRMELTGVISALESLSADITEATVHSDSKYVVEGIIGWIKNWKKNNWKTAKKTDVINKDLWQRLDSLVSKRKTSFKWVKGHSTPEIELVDTLAKKETQMLLEQGNE